MIRSSGEIRSSRRAHVRWWVVVWIALRGTHRDIVSRRSADSVAWGPGIDSSYRLPESLGVYIHTEKFSLSITCVPTFHRQIVANAPNALVHPRSTGSGSFHLPESIKGFVDVWFLRPWLTLATQRAPIGRTRLSSHAPYQLFGFTRFDLGNTAP